MKTRELILVLIIIGYFLAVFSSLAIEYNIALENNKDRPIMMVKVDGNGTVTRYQVPNPAPDPDISTGIFLAMERFTLALPFAIAGLGMISGPMILITNNFSIPPEGYRVMGLWLIAMSTIPITFLFSKDIPLFRRILYIYLLAALISGAPLLFNSEFGR